MSKFVVVYQGRVSVEADNYGDAQLKALKLLRDDEIPTKIFRNDTPEEQYANRFSKTWDQFVRFGIERREMSDEMLKRKD